MQNNVDEVVMISVDLPYSCHGNSASGIVQECIAHPDNNLEIENHSRSDSDLVLDDSPRPLLSNSPELVRRPILKDQSTETDHFEELFEAESSSFTITDILRSDKAMNSCATSYVTRISEYQFFVCYMKDVMQKKWNRNYSISNT